VDEILEPLEAPHFPKGNTKASPRPRAEPILAGVKLVRPTLYGLCLLALGCQSEATKRCLTLMTSAQTVVKEVDAKDQTSVETSLAAVEGAFAACTEAGRTGEADELLKAKNELKGHLDYMKQRASRSPVKKLSPAERLALVESGDPSCPKGQAYLDTELKKEVRCSGPQTADMSWAKAKEYYENRGYKITEVDSPPTLKAEYGAELFVYTYGSPKDPGPPKCLAIYPPPGMSWQEAAARATGVPPRKLEDTTTVKTGRGTLPMSVVDRETKMVIRIGDCAG